MCGIDDSLAADWWFKGFASSAKCRVMAAILDGCKCDACGPIREGRERSEPHMLSLGGIVTYWCPGW